MYIMYKIYEQKYKNNLLEIGRENVENGQNNNAKKKENLKTRTKFPISHLSMN